MKQILQVFIITLLTICICSCNNNNETKKLNKENPDQAKRFEAFLKKFNTAQVPITIKGCKVLGEGLNDLSKEKDSPFVEELSVAYYTFQPNGDYVATITLGLADCMLPILTTYDKSGNKIDQKTIAIGQCGSDCGYTCEEFMTIKSDFTLFTSDTISSSECDSLGKIIPGTTTKHVVYKKGKLLSDGKIELSEEIEEKLK